MSAAAAHPDIDASIARGEWWLRLFYALARRGESRQAALTETRGGLARGAFRAMDRAARAMRLALVAVRRLRQILAALAALRLRSAADIAALRARAQAAAKAHDQAQQRRMTFDDGEAEDEDWDEDWDERDAPDRETLDRLPGDGLVDALDRRLAAVDPILVDFDDLGLRETVLRLCADLGVTPDWARWEAGDWTTLETPDPPAPAPPPRALPPWRRRHDILRDRRSFPVCPHRSRDRRSGPRSTGSWLNAPPSDRAPGWSERPAPPCPCDGCDRRTPGPAASTHVGADLGLTPPATARPP